MAGTGIGRELGEVAALLIGVALIALILNRSGGTVDIINAGTRGFNELLRTVTLQGSPSYYY